MEGMEGWGMFQEVFMVVLITRALPKYVINNHEQCVKH